MKNREELDLMLDQVEAGLPKMLEEHPDDEIWAAFAGAVDVIEDQAGKDDCEHIRARISCMLGSAGLIPSDNEGEPCH